MTLRIDVRPACGCSFFIFPKGWYGCVRYKNLTWVKTTEIPTWCARKYNLHYSVGQGDIVRQFSMSFVMLTIYHFVTRFAWNSCDFAQNIISFFQIHTGRTITMTLVQTSRINVSPWLPKYRPNLAHAM